MASVSIICGHMTLYVAKILIIAFPRISGQSIDLITLAPSDTYYRFDCDLAFFVREERKYFTPET